MNNQFEENNQLENVIETEEVITTEEVVETEAIAEETTPDTAPETAAEDLPAEEVLEDLSDKKPKKVWGRKWRYGSMSLAITVIAIVGVVVLNLLMDALFARFPLSVDMTADSRFTMSQDTLDVIASIDRPVEIIAFFEESYIRTPSTETDEINTVYKELHEALTQYEAKSNGQVTVKYVDLANNPTLLKEYEAYGNVVQGNILFRSGTGTSERKRLKSLSDFFTFTTDSTGYYLQSFSSRVEITMAASVNAVISDAQQELMILTGHDEDEFVMAALTDLYNLNGYTVSKINLASAQEIGKDVTTAIIAAPENDLSAAEITRLRDWLTNDGKLGRHLMVITNSLATKEDCPNLYEFLDDEYQIEVTDNLVMETDTNRYMVDGYGNILHYGDLPVSPVQEEVEKSSGVLMYAARQLLLKAGTDNEKTLYNIPIVTFPESAQILSLTGGEDAKLEDAESYPMVGMGMSVKWTYDNTGEESEQVWTQVVVADAGMIHSNLFAMNSIENSRVALDIMNYINGNEEVVTLMDKDITPDSLELEAGTANTLGILLVIVLPVCVLGICLVVFLRRRHL